MMGQQEPGGQQAGDDPVSSSSDEELIHNGARGPSPTWQSPVAAGAPTGPLASRRRPAPHSTLFFFALGGAPGAFSAPGGPPPPARVGAGPRDAPHRRRALSS